MSKPIQQLQDYNWLYEHYTTKDMSCRSIAKLINCGPQAVKNALNRHNIPKTEKRKGGKKTKTYDLIGRQFGYLLVTGRFGKGLWNCLCKCGNTKQYCVTNLKRGDYVSCGCKPHPLVGWKGIGELSGTFFGRIKNNAKTRKIDFLVTQEYLWNLFLKQNRKCAISGEIICFASQARASDGTASLDRIDTNKNYTEDNVQWVHKDINWMKLDFDQQEFINWCHLVAKNNPI